MTTADDPAVTWVACPSATSEAASCVMMTTTAVADRAAGRVIVMIVATSPATMTTTGAPSDHAAAHAIATIVAASPAMTTTAEAAAEAAATHHMRTAAAGTATRVGTHRLRGWVGVIGTDERPD